MRRSSTNNRRRKHSSVRKIRNLFTGTLLTIILCITGSAFLVSAHEADDSGYTCYKSIEIQSGDTLWDIAAAAKPDAYDSTAGYVQVIKDMNQLESDHIESGQHLIIEYYNHSDLSDIS